MTMRLLGFTLATLLSFSPGALGENDYEWLEEEGPLAFDVAGVVRLPAGAPAEATAQIVLNHHGPDQHYVVALTRGQLTAAKVVGGKATPLWPARPLPDGSEHRLVIKRRADRFAVVVDGELAGQVQDPGRPGGKVGASASGGAVLARLLCQEVEPVYFADDFMRGDGELGLWESVSGEWRVKSIESAQVDPGRSVNPFSCAVRAPRRGLAVTGYWFWDSYLFRASVKPEATGAVGLLVFYQDPRNYVLFRWRSRDRASGDGARQLVCVRDGTEQVHPAPGVGYEPGQWYQLSVQATDTRLSTFIDDAAVGTLEAPPFCYGQIGLYVENCASAAFDDVLCRHWEGPADDFSPLLEAARPPLLFSREDTMSGWARPESDWLPGEQGWRWNKGTFWGDAALTGEIQGNQDPDARVEWVIHANEADPKSGYKLTVTPNPDASRLACALERQGKPLGQKQVEVRGWPVTVELRRCQKTLLVEVDSERVLMVADEQPLPGTRTAVRATGLTVPAEALFATGSNLLDDLFLMAPTQWWQGQGQWQVASRWSCQPGWTWLTGTGNSSPVLWSKRAFGGDFTVEAFVANRMDRPGQAGYSHPGDLNLTVCGDGRSLTSGYSFVFAGWDNTCSALFRHTQCVARNEEPLRSAGPPSGLAPFTAGGRIQILPDPVNTNNNFHRHWFRVRVERRGHRLEHWVDDMLVHTYEDPDPLPAGRLALWTCGVDPQQGGLVVARIRVWYEQAAAAEDFPGDGFRTDTAGPWLEPGR